MPDQQQQINYGAAPNDGQGDPLRDAFIKTDDNFDAIWNAGPVGSNVTVLNNTVAVVNTNGNLVLKPNGVGVIQANASIVPDSANIRDLGAANRRWRRVYLQTLNTVDYEVEGNLTVSGNLTIQGDTIQIGNLVTDARTLQLANTAANAAQATGSGITVGASDDIATLLYDSGNNVWTTNIGIQVGGAITGTTISVSDATIYGNIDAVNGNFTGNATANYFIGDGSQLTGLPEQYGNANVADLLADFGSNNIVTTGNISGGQLEIAPGGGNAWTISGQTILAPSGGEWRSEDDSLDDFITSAPNGYINMQSLYADGNIASELKLEHGVARLVIADAPFAEWTFNTTGQLDVPGDIVPDANGVYSLGSESLQWANLWIANNTIYLGGVALGISAGNVLTVNGNTITGNVTFSGEAVIGTGTSNTQSGLYLAPDPGSLANDLYLRVRGNIQDEPTHIHFDTGNNQYYNLIIGDDNKYVQLANTGNIVINTNDYAGNSAQWTFDYNGVLTVPASNVVPGQISTQTTTQNEKGFDLSITAGNTNGCTVPGGDLYLSAGVGYNGVSHGAGNVNIVTGDRYGNLTGNIWNFGTDGALTLPLGGVRIKDTAGNAVAFGLGAGQTSQGTDAVAIGSLAGNSSQGSGAVAIGSAAGAGGSVSTNYVSGAVSPSTTLIVASTTGIVPGMVITGTGFFSNQTVVTVTNSTTLEISASAGFTPSGALNFTGSQGDNSVAIGTQAGQVQQGQFAVAIGHLAGNASQGNAAVAVGASAGQTTQGVHAVAIGTDSGATTQGNRAVAIGYLAGSTAQGTAAVAIGYYAGELNQGNNSIIINATDTALQQTTANTFTVAPVRNDVANVGEVVFYNTTSKEITYGNTISVAGNITGGNISTGQGLVQSLDITADGIINAGALNVNSSAVPGATGNITGGNLSVTGNITGGNLIATGNIVLTGSLIGSGASPAPSLSGFSSVSAVTVSASGNVSGGNIIVGSAGSIYFPGQGVLTYKAGNSISFGYQAAQTNQEGNCIAIGFQAGDNTQREYSIGIGYRAGGFQQTGYSIAIGTEAGHSQQSGSAVALGWRAGYENQGSSAVAIGRYAGYNSQGNNSIILNATGNFLNQTTANTFTVAPIRNDVANVGNVLFYNTTSKEITYGNVISVAGNITGGNILTGGLISATGNITGNYILGNGSQLTSINAVTVDITDTNGLTTVYYPTFVENRTTAQIARADVDLTYRTDDNLLTVGNVSVTGNVTGNTAGFAIGYRDIPQVAFTANATIATTDAGKHFYSTQSTDYILTIANNASQGFQTGAAITVVNQGTGNITVAQGSGVTLYLAGNATSGNRTVSTFGMATIMKVATDTWFINGTGVA